MPSATTVRGGRQATWTRDNIIDALRRYAAMYGDDFTQAAFSPSSAKWAARPDLAERYFAGDEQGNPWPSLNAIKSKFGGSWSAAREAAGLAANKPGPSKTKRAAGEAEPIRDVRHVTRVIHREVDGGETRRRAERAEARAARLEARVERLEARLAARPKAAPTPKAAPAPTKIKTKTKTVRVRDERAIERLAAKLDAAREAEKALRVDLAEARQAATRAVSKRERAEATISELRDERRDLKAEVGDLEDRLVAQEKLIERIEAEKALAPDPVVIREASPEAAEVRAARKAEREADVRAAKAEREYRELVVAVKGEDRKLTKGELAELRTGGPSGPAVLAKALKGLATARAQGGNRTALFAALTGVASAAVGWRDRL